MWWEGLVYWLFWGLLFTGLGWSRWHDRQRRQRWIEQTVLCRHCRGTGRHAPWSVPAEDRPASCTDTPAAGEGQDVK